MRMRRVPGFLQDGGRRVGAVDGFTQLIAQEFLARVQRQGVHLEPAGTAAGGHRRECWQVESQRLSTAGACADDHSAAARPRSATGNRSRRVQLEPGQFPAADLRGGDLVLQWTQPCTCRVL